MADNANEKSTIKTLEQGDIYFFYRPKIGVEDPENLQDVERTYMLLSPQDKEKYRLAILGRKKLPEPNKSGYEKYWGFIETVRKSPKSIHDELGADRYQTKTRGERYLPAARPAGEGVYRIIRHNDHTHLIYVLELPKQPGEVQQELQIEPEASYIISVKNPDRGSPKAAGLSEDQEANFPQRLMKIFRGRKFADVDPPDFLDHEGAEFLLIAASDIQDELGIHIDNSKSESSAGIFEDLKMDRSERSTKPLFQGEWI